ncbi:MAG TPA: recombinase family protein, partial [Acetobacteraceae bacterium]|nr:recombinase family protein [Acetobacteraceae bacterium]
MGDTVGRCGGWLDHDAISESRAAACSAEIKTFGNSVCPSNFSKLFFPKDMTESDTLPRRLGYARVGTYGQTLDAQLEQLRADGCAKICREKASGAQADRRELLRLLKDL